MLLESNEFVDVWFTLPLFKFENLLFLDYSFLLYDNFIALNHSVFISNFTTAKKFLSEYYIDKKNQPVVKNQFDKCGNLNFDVQEYYLESREAKGGWKATLKQNFKKP